MGDGVLVVPDAPHVIQTDSGDARLESLREHGWARLREDVARALTTPEAARRIAGHLLTADVPSALHEDVCDLLGVVASAEQTWRSADFVHAVRLAYGGECALCGFAGKVDFRPVALEAAHIRMRSLGGTDTVDNGLLLCSTDHKLFDTGAWTLDDERRMIVSPRFTEAGGLRRTPLHGEPIAVVGHDRSPPALANIRWHREQLFRT